MIVKNEADLAGLQEICRIVAITLKEMGEAINPGITTKELDEIGRSALSRYGARSAPITCYNFPGHTCICVNEEVAHGIPGDRVIQEGDLVNIDVSAVKDGFYGDNGASFAVGQIKGIHKKLLECGKRALQKAISVSMAGYPLNGIGLAVEKEAHKNGFRTIRNLCGHGVGRSLHENPESIYNYYERKDKRLLAPGLVLAIEPFISERDEYVEEQLDGWTLITPNKSRTAQFEHTIVVTEGAPVILTLCD